MNTSQASASTTIAKQPVSVPARLMDAIGAVSAVVRDTLAATEYGCQMYGDRYALSRGKYNLGIIRAGISLLERLTDGDCRDIPVEFLADGTDTDIRVFLRTVISSSSSSNPTTH